MTTIELRPDLAEKLSHEAERRQTSVAALANDWLEEQWWIEQHKKIDEETQRYQSQHAQLLAQYAGRVIAMFQGEIVAVGDHFGEVNRLIRARFGDEAVLITRVGEEPVETYTIRSPRLNVSDR